MSRVWQTTAALIGLKGGLVQGGEGHVVMILITLLFFCILKSLYADNHNNLGEEREGRGQ
jgi:hypothetical protein